QSTTSFAFNLWNNLFFGGTLNLNAGSGATWAAYDNLFDASAIGAASVPNDYNGYIGGSPMTGSGSHYKTVATRDYQSGPLGTNYYPTAGVNLFILIGAGSRSAVAAGLYHHT